MPKDPTQVLTAGPSTRLLLAPVGTAEPADHAASFSGTWVDMGYLADPPDFERDRSTSDVEAWNALDPIRTLVESDISSVTFALMQTNRAVFELYFGQLTYTTAGTGIKVEPAAVQTDVEKAIALELVDGSNVLRLIWRRSVVEDVGDFSMDKADAIKYEMTFKRLAPVSGASYAFLTNVAGLVTP